ncbi:Rpn family recombination-promoting nuclease/putative transposase [Paenibacillus sp. CAU 1782]
MEALAILKEESGTYGTESYVDLKADFAFKQMFGQEESRSILLAFLNALLDFENKGYAKIASVDILNNEIEREHRADKKAVLDLLARTDDGTLIHIELQLIGVPHLASRQLYYWSRIYSKQLEKGRPYADLKRTISILISNADLLPQTVHYHSRFGLHESKQHFLLTDKLEIHVIELQKLLKAAKAGQADPWTDAEIRWLLMLAAVQGGEMQPQLLNKLEAIALKNDSDLQEALERWESMSRDPKVWGQYEMWHKAMMDDAAYKAEMEMLREEKDRLESERESLKSETESLKSQTESLKSQTESLKSQTESLTLEKDLMKQQLVGTGKKLLDSGFSIEEASRITGLSPDDLA